MRDEAAIPLVTRLHGVAARLSLAGRHIVVRADVAEAAARLVLLETALDGLLDHIDHVAYLDATGSRLSDATPAVRTAWLVRYE